MKRERGARGKVGKASGRARPVPAGAGAASRREPAPARKPKPPRAPFPRKDQAPSEAEFAARLPIAVGKKFASVRAALCKPRDVSEALYFFGPKTGWAYRYVRRGHSLATIVIHADRLLGIVALDPVTRSHVDFAALSAVAREALRSAHGTPALSWLDLPLEGTGAADFKALVKAKLRALDEGEGEGDDAGGTPLAPARSARRPSPVTTPRKATEPREAPVGIEPRGGAFLSKN